jgi:sensor c-di-GMP phosphodiesterase-like protein
MGRFSGFLIARTNSRSQRGLLGVLIAAILLACAGWVAAEQLAQNMRGELDRNLAAYAGFRDTLVSTLDAMETVVTAEPCSLAFLDQLREVAFLPDGINELLYAPNGQIVCSVNTGRLAIPHELGEPQIPPTGRYAIALWLRQDLAFLDLEGTTGTIAKRGNFAMVVPQQILPSNHVDWMDKELIYRADGGQWLHRSGTEGLHAAGATAPASAMLGTLTGQLYQELCEPDGEHCVAGRAALIPYLMSNWATVATVLLVVAVFAAWFTQQICAVVQRHWSFEERFLRKLEKGSIVCAYQPLLHLRTNQIIGCEVLARWRDVDGAIVSPDQFLPLIEKHGLTEHFTTLVVAAAHAELAARWLSGKRLQVNFNIFPCDLDASRLIPIFAPFTGAGSPFDIVVELVETAEVKPETAQVEIERLRAAGISTYIDDFGAGYSSMHNLAELSVEGVKLDRSFAMAPEDSVMARMLHHAIDLMHASGRALVVEGVETAERLEALRVNGRVDIVQGYFVSRPLPIEAFLAFISEHDAQEVAERFVA